MVGAAAASSDCATKRRATDSEKNRVRNLQEQYKQLSAILKSIRVHLAAGSKVVKIFTHLRIIIGIT